MHKSINAGAHVVGTSTTTINYSGNYSVEALPGQSAHAGSKFSGEQRGDLNSSENNTVTCVTSSNQQDGMDQLAVRQDVTVQGMETPRVGDTVMLVPPSEDKVKKVQYDNKGAAISCKRITGKIRNTITYRGGVPDEVPMGYLSADSERHTNYGSVTRVGEVAQSVDLNADVQITQNNN